MKVLLDTQAFLWFVLGDARFSDVAKSTILDSSNKKSISPATYWEIAIKVSLRKYELPEPFEVFIEREISHCPIITVFA